VHREFVPTGLSVTGHFYVQVLQRLREAFRRKRRDKWQEQWFLHHDNAPGHTLVVQQFLAVENISVITQSPHSPDLAPSDSFLFLALKMGCMGTRFETGHQIELRGFQKEPSAGASNKGKVDGANVCARARNVYYEDD
jgi:hypothetical protein